MKRKLSTILLTMLPLLAWSDNITFADANVKAICVQNWDTNSDGELSYAEAEAVTDLGKKFSGTSIQSFDELKYFTGLTIVIYEAFHSCRSLTSITIPSSVTSIGRDAFSFCSNLTSIKVESGNIIFDSRDNCNAIIESGTNRLIVGCKNTIIPNSVASIGSGAFSGSGLTTIEIPSSVGFIDSRAFSYCSGLTSITVDSENSRYDSRDNCNAIIESDTNELIAGCKNTIIPNSVTNIGGYAFYGYSSLTSIEIPNSVTCIDYSAFSGCSGLTSIVIPNSVTSIGDNAFSRCSGLTSIEIPNSVTCIGGSAFSGCHGLTSIVIPNSVTSIGSNAFFGCSGLTSIEIPNSMTSIGDFVFNNCIGLTSMVIPNSVTSIGNYAFSYCYGLTSIIIPNSVTSIGSYAFEGCGNLTSIVVPNSVTSIGSYAFAGCIGLTSITVDSENSTYDSRDNCNAIIETGTNTLIAGFKNTIIPNSVTSIGNSAFAYCSGLTSIEIPNSVTSIGNFAFQSCSGLTSITIPNSVTSIGYSAFYDCNKLTEATVENPNPVAINSTTFTNRKNATLYVPKGSKAAYEAADYWKEFKEIVEITKSSYLEVADTVGFTGKQLVLPIKLKNTDEIAGVQFKLTLPQGVSVALNSKNKLMFSKTERDADHTLSGSKAEDGTYTVLLYSADTEAITGNEGSIIDVTLDIDKEMEDGTYEIKISDIVLSTTKAVKINGDDVTAQLEVKSYLLGDPNNDGSIDVVDITMIANHILGNNPENFIFAAADVDADGTVDVNDIISIANIILYGSNSQGAKAMRAKARYDMENNVTADTQGDGFTVKNVNVEKGGAVTMDFELTSSAHDFSGIQMDIELGDGLTFETKSNGKVKVTKGARLEDEDFTLSVAKQTGSTYRALGYYTDGSVIPEKNGTLFTLTLMADEALADGKTFDCKLNNITLSTKNSEKIQQDAQSFTVTIGDATSISAIDMANGTVEVFDLSGRKLESRVKAGKVIVVRKNGKTMKMVKK